MHDVSHIVRLKCSSTVRSRDCFAVGDDTVLIERQSLRAAVDSLSTLTFWIRARRALVRRTHSAAIVALAKCIAPSAAAEEPATPAVCDSATKSSDESEPAAASTATAAGTEVSGAQAPASQVVVEPNLEEPYPAEVAIDTTAAADTKPAPAPSPKKETRLLGIRLPAFIALSVGGLGAGGAVVTRIASNWPSTDLKGGCNGHCTDGAKTLQTTSTILSGIAVAAAGTGVVLALSNSGKAHKRLASLPVLGMSVSPSKAAASASWTF